jgi:hypothetical protein
VNNQQISSAATALNRLKAVARANCKNILSDVDYNKYGWRSNVNFEPVSEFFVDTLIVYVDIEHGEDVAKLKAVLTAELRFFFERFVSLNLISITVTVDVKNNIVKWRIACPVVDLVSVSQIMKEISADSNRFYIGEVDITRDFAGSFKLDEVIEHFQNNFGLVTGFESDCYFMEKDMKQCTGSNCFVMKKENLRCKMYLKFPQMICKGKVRDDLGFNLRNWVQPGGVYSRLHSAIYSKSAQERGLTRIEISIKNPGSDVEELKRVHMNFTDKLSSSLVWNTSHASMWKAFADNLKHTLIVVDEDISLAKDEKGLAIVVYGFDHLTRDLCGIEVRNWRKIRKCLQVVSRFTCSSLLPIDLIKVSKIQNGKRNLNLHIEGARYQKIMKKGHADVTFLSDSNGRFCSSGCDVDLEGCGLVKHPNMDLLLPLKQYSCNSVVPAQVVLIDELEVKVFGEDDDGQFVNRFLSAENVEELPLFYKSKTIASDIECEMAMDLSSRKIPCDSLLKLNDGFYDVLKIEKVSANAYPFMVVNVEGVLKKVSMNRKLESEFEEQKMKNGSIFPKTRLYVRKINKHKTNTSLKTVIS